MLYKKDERDVIKDTLNTELLAKTTLQSGTLQDIKDNLYEHFLTLRGSPYHSKKKDFGDEKDKIVKRIEKLELTDIPDTEGKIALIDPKTGNPNMLKELNSRLDSYKKNVTSEKASLKTIEGEMTTLDNDLETVVNGYVDEKVKGILELEDKYLTLLDAPEIPGVVDKATEEAWIKTKVSDITNRAYIRGSLENTYAELLAKDHLKKAHNNLIVPTIAANTNTNVQNLNTTTRADLRNYFLNRTDDERKEINSILSSIDITTNKNDALSTIKDKAKKQGEELETLNTDYKKIKEELEEHLTAPTDLNLSWLNVVRTYGKSLANGEDIKEVLKTSTDYQEISEAYLIHKLNEAYRSTTYIRDEIDDADALLANTDMKVKKEALKKITALKNNINGMRDIALRKLNEELKDAYKNVIMGSSLDDGSNNTGEFEEWFMFGKDDKIVENHNIETYAQLGLGAFQELFLADPDLETAFYELQGDVVNKHKKASSWLHGGFFNRKKNTKIEVKEVLKLGLGYTLYNDDEPEELADELNDMWTEIKDMHIAGARNTIKEISDKYRKASKFGEELNDTAKEWTLRENGGYNEVDNHVNALSGWTFKLVDTVWDFVGKKWSGLRGKEPGKYNVDITAIKPKYHPHLQMMLGLMGAGAAIAVTADEAGKTLGSNIPFTEKLGKMGDIVEKYFTIKGLGEAATGATKH